MGSYKLRKSKFLGPLLKGLSDLNKFLTKRKDFSWNTGWTIKGSREEAMHRDAAYIGLAHILLSILKLEKGKAFEMLKKLKCNIRDLRQEVEKVVVGLPKRDRSFDLPFTKSASNALKFASIIADKFNSEEIENEHLLLAILHEDSSLLAPIFRKFNLSYELCYVQLRKLQGN
ncbi:MAG: Clp protease N-terminal domain-containing protein [bacterium]